MSLSDFLELIQGQQTYAVLLFMVMLLVALFEGFGLSLVLPLLSSLVGQDFEFPVFSGVLRFLLSPFPQGYRMEGLLTLLIIAFLGKSLLMVLHTGMVTHFAMQLRERWVGRIFSNYMRRQYAKIIGEKHGTLINNILVEPLNASRAITLALQIFSKIVMSLTLLVLLLLTDAMMVFAIGVGGGIILYFLWKTTHRYSMSFGKERLRLSQQTTAVSTEGLAAVREIKIYGAADRHQSSLAEKLARYKTIQTKFAIFSHMPSNLGELVVIGFIALLLIIYIRISGNTAIKEVIPLAGFFIIVSQRLLVYVSFIISQRMKIVAVVPSLKLIHTLIHEHEQEGEPVGGQTFTTVQSDILLKDIDFSYEQGKPVFRKLNLKISKGKVTGIIGPSGSGKSTICDLILRLFEPQSGEILVNGKNLQAWDATTWRRKIGYVSQEPFIFNVSVKENILVGDPTAELDQIVKAAKMANIHDFIRSLPEGYDTVVGDRGVKLSGGQKQRIAIARAIVRDPELFIFDEATSSLDSESEKLIQESIERLSRTKTILLIAHRTSTLSNADIIYELGQNGDVRMLGPDQLRARNLA